MFQKKEKNSGLDECEEEKLEMLETNVPLERKRKYDEDKDDENDGKEEEEQKEGKVEEQDGDKKEGNKRQKVTSTASNASLLTFD